MYMHTSHKPAIKVFPDVLDPKTGKAIHAANKEAARAKRKRIKEKLINAIINQEVYDK